MINASAFLAAVVARNDFERITESDRDQVRRTFGVTVGPNAVVSYGGSSSGPGADAASADLVVDGAFLYAWVGDPGIGLTFRLTGV